MQKHADGLRLVKEVLLQRYLESLLRLFKCIPMTSLLWRNCVSATNLGQLVLPDIYNCNAIYTLKNIQRIDDDQTSGAEKPKLSLVQKENQLSSPFKSRDITIPPTVVAKLRQLLIKQQQKTVLEKHKQDEKSDLKSILRMLEDVKNELKELRVQQLHNASF